MYVSHLDAIFRPHPGHVGQLLYSINANVVYVTMATIVVVMIIHEYSARGNCDQQHHCDTFLFTARFARGKSKVKRTTFRVSVIHGRYPGEGLDIVEFSRVICL